MGIVRSYYWSIRLTKRRHKLLAIFLTTIFILVTYYVTQLQHSHIVIHDDVPTRIERLNPNSIKQLSQDIKISYKVKINKGWNENINEVVLQNTGSNPILLGQTTLYFSSLKTIFQTSNDHLKITHIDGPLYKIEPVSASLQIVPGQIIKLEHKAKVYSSSRTDVMPNWFFVGPRNAVIPVKNTLGEDLSFVANFTSRDQWKRNPGDEYDPYTPEKRYDFISFDSQEDESLSVAIPQPMEVKDLEGEKAMVIDKQWKLYYEHELENEASYIRDIFQISKDSGGIPNNPTKYISLRIGDTQFGKELDASLEQQSYILVVKAAKQSVEIIGKTATGVFYGIQTLRALADQNGAVPSITIKDAPRFSYRGQQLDVARNFMNKNAILRLLDVMSMYKLNKFHFHLTDDEAWRIEIPGLPELTEIGSRQCHDPTGLKCVPMVLGANPLVTTPQYYTVKDYQEILRYAEQRHIQVVPEFDLPAHSNAAIKSMEARYWFYKNQGEVTKAEEFLLTDFNDATKYSSIQDYTHNTINPCMESTYRFITHVIQSLKDIHKDIQPLTIYHFGGDEIPNGAWKDSPACLKVIKEDDYSTKRRKLKEYFVKRVGKIADSLGMIFGGWDDFFPDNEKLFPNKDIVVWSWNDLPELGGGRKAYQLARAGYEVVLAHASHLYFDHPQEPDPEERGFFWATRFTDTRKVFQYIPNFCKTAGKCNDVSSEKNIRGITGCLWGETVRTVDELEYMVFPRMLSLAERAWHKAPWENIQDESELKKERDKEWKAFSSFIVKHELARLEKIGIKYRIPLPGIRFDGKSLKVRTLLPGLPVQLSTDEGKSWNDVTKDTQIVKEAVLRTMSLDRRRTSREVKARPLN